MLNNTTVFINQSLNDTITNATIYANAFASPTIRYIRFQDISNVSDAVTFYKACVGYYPHIFIPVVIISFMIGYAIIKDVIKNE